MVDNTIAMGFNPTPMNAPNPMDMATRMMEFQRNVLGIQSGQLELTQRRNMLAARQRAGQIFATSPDMLSAQKALMADPLTSSYASDLAQGAGDMANQIETNKNLKLSGQSTASQIGTDAFKGVTQAALRAVATGDPTQVGPAIDSFISSQPAATQAQIKAAAGSVKQFLGGPDVVKNPALLKQRGVALLMGIGVGPESMSAILPQGEDLDVGGQIQPGVRAPALEGGGFTPSGPAIAKGIGPSVQQSQTGGFIGVPGIGATRGGVPLGPMGLPPGPGVASGAASPATPATQQPPAASADTTMQVNPMALPVTPMGKTSPKQAAGAAGQLGALAQGMNPGQSAITTPGSASGTPASAGANVAGDGKPLYDPKLAGPGIKMKVDANGLPIGGSSQAAAIATANEQYTQSQKDAQQADIGLGQLTQMEDAFDKLGANGGFLASGSLGQLRGTIGGLVNQLQNVFGVSDKDLAFDPNKIGSIEELNKLTTRMGATLTQNMFGGGHEAYQTISNMTGSVPNLENTYTGAKMVIAGISSAFQRQKDWANFQNEWLNDGQHSSLAGAQESFNKTHPAQAYAQQVLNKFGIPKEGFHDAQAVADAFKAKKIDSQTAWDILHNQFKIPSRAAGTATPQGAQ